MTTNVSPDTKTTKNGSFWVGVLLIALGIAGLVLPSLSTIVVETWISLLLVSAGSAKIVYAFQNRNSDRFVWNLLLGILYIATGVMLFFNPLTGVLTLTLLLGSFLLTEGTFELILAFRLRGQQNWTWVLGNAILTLLFGALVWFQFPFNAPWLIGTLVGASVLFSGISRLALSLQGGSVANSPDQTASV